MIPFFMFIIMFPVLGQFWSRIVAALLFGLTALTDMLDGKIARKHNLVTDFGKFMDPVADKLMTIGGYIALLTTISYD
jgi:CDP-diacylglycerol--glycerol-3-phosphate 3-phosphatidyltransferase